MVPCEGLIWVFQYMRGVVGVGHCVFVCLGLYLGMGWVWYVWPVSMEALGWAQWWGLLFVGPVCVSFLVVAVGFCLLLEGYFVL